MVFSSLLGFLLVVVSVASTPIDECVQNASLPMCHPRRALAEDEFGETLQKCVGRFPNPEACDHCRRHQNEPECAGYSEIGQSTWGCLIDRKWKVCHVCENNSSLKECYGFPSLRYEYIRGLAIKECFEDVKNQEACDFCRNNGYDSKCDFYFREYGYHSVRCVVRNISESCDICNDGTYLLSCEAFPSFRKEDVTSKTLKQCLDDPKNSPGCDFCKKNRSNKRCKQSPLFGDLTLACALDKNSEACDTCNDKTNPFECRGFPDSLIEDVTGKTFQECMTGPKDNGACYFCRKNQLNTRCERSPDFGSLTVDCVVNGNSEACDICNDETDRAECVGLPIFHKEDITGKTMTECINGPKGNGACDFCRNNQSSKRCEKPANIGVETVRCVLNKNEESCDMCNDQTNREECSGFPASYTEDVTGKAMKACIDGRKNNYVCYFCRRYRFNIRCQRPSSIGDRTVECVLDKKSEACDTCNDGTNRPECVGFPVSHIEDVTGKTLKACVNGPKDNEACDFCRSNQFNTRCQRPSVIGEATVECVLNKKSEACDICNDGTYRPECVGFPATHVEDVIGTSLRQCINGPKNNKFCTYCEQHWFNIRCQRPSDIGEMTVDCVINGNQNACEKCKRRFLQPECAGLPAPSTENYGTIMKKCYDDRDLDACRYCFTRLNEPECRRSFVGLAKSELLVDNAETGLAIIASKHTQHKIAEKPFAISGRIGTNRNWTFVGSDGLKSRIN